MKSTNANRINYVIDTSAIIDDPYVFFKFPQSNVVLPIVVLEELDHLKTKQEAVGKTARLAIKIIESLTTLGNVANGVDLEDGITFSVESSSFPSTELEPDKGDARILSTAYALKNLRREAVVVISNDINMVVRARAKGMEARFHQIDNVVPHNSDEMYSGYKEVVHTDAGNELIAAGFIDPRLFNLDLAINESVILKNDDNKTICFGRKVKSDRLNLIRGATAFGIKSRNKEQALALDALLDPKISLVTLVGSAGSGKTLITLAAGLNQVMEKGAYERFILYRPTIPVGQDIGFLPGSESEKLAPWFEAIMDNLEVIVGSRKKLSSQLELWQSKEKISFEAMTYIRGRSITKSFILFDECQNITKEEVKTILTRVGDGTKIVMLGDICQIDSHKLDKTNNGLSYIVEKFRDCELAAHITLKDGVRSPLATKAAEILLNVNG